MASASESGEGAASCDWAGRASSCSSMKSGAPGDAMWRRLALVIVTNSAGRVLVRQKRPACTARDIRSRHAPRAVVAGRARNRARNVCQALEPTHTSGSLFFLAKTYFEK